WDEAHEPGDGRGLRRRQAARVRAGAGLSEGSPRQGEGGREPWVQAGDPRQPEGWAAPHHSREVCGSGAEVFSEDVPGVVSGHEHSRPSSRPSRTPRPALAAAAILVLEARRKPVRALRVRATVLEVDGAETARDRRRPGWLGPRLETSRPEAESKARVPRHAGRRGLAIVKRALAPARPWCPQLFHGRDCAPG